MTNFETEAVARFANFSAKLRDLFTIRAAHTSRTSHAKGVDTNSANYIGLMSGNNQNAVHVNSNLSRQKIAGLSGIDSRDGIPRDHQRILSLSLRHRHCHHHGAQLAVHIPSHASRNNPQTSQRVRPGMAPRWKDMQRVSIVIA